MSRFLSVQCQGNHEGCPVTTPDRASRCACSCHATAARNARFEAFHRNNPVIYTELVRLAREAKAAGAKKLGVRSLWERLRWWLRYEVKREGEWRLNDHLTSSYSRLIMQQEPDLAGFFETRGDAKPEAAPEPAPEPYRPPEQDELFGDGGAA